MKKKRLFLGLVFVCITLISFAQFSFHESSLENGYFGGIREAIEVENNDTEEVRSTIDQLAQTISQSTGNQLFFNDTLKIENTTKLLIYAMVYEVKVTGLTYAEAADNVVPRFKQNCYKIYIRKNDITSRIAPRASFLIYHLSTFAEQEKSSEYAVAIIDKIAPAFSYAYDVMLNFDLYTSQTLAMKVKNPESVDLVSTYFQMLVAKIREQGPNNLAQNVAQILQDNGIEPTSKMLERNKTIDDNLLRFNVTRLESIAVKDVIKAIFDTPLVGPGYTQYNENLIMNRLDANDLGLSTREMIETIIYDIVRSNATTKLKARYLEKFVAFAFIYGDKNEIAPLAIANNLKTKLSSAGVTDNQLKSFAIMIHPLNPRDPGDELDVDSFKETLQTYDLASKMKEFYIAILKRFSDETNVVGLIFEADDSASPYTLCNQYNQLEQNLKTDFVYIHLIAVVCKRVYESNPGINLGVGINTVLTDCSTEIKKYSYPDSIFFKLVERLLDYYNIPKAKQAQIRALFEEAL